ncbi:MAG: N-acetylmuramoyl-L-alanine amidase [Mycoplasmatales bacterium]
MKKLIYSTPIILIIIIIVFVIVNKIISNPLFNTPTIDIDSYNIYGESLNISINDSFENTLNFLNIQSNNNQEIMTSQAIDDGVDPVSLNVGEYYIFDTQGNALTSETVIDEKYYTITRDKQNYQIKFYTNAKGYLVYAKTLSELPENEYDIIIDPGHGGDDSGAIGIDNVTYEKDVNLTISEYLKEQLTAMGYKVAITREDDSNPGCEGVANYCEGGRVDQVYETNAKIVLSIHNNAGGGSGFEVYDSTFSSHTLAREFVTSLSQYFTISDKETDLTETGIYNPLYENVDYYFMIRETGGVATHGISENNENSNSTQGAEGFILELEYLDNYVDLQTILDDANQQLLAKLISEAVDNYVNS